MTQQPIKDNPLTPLEKLLADKHRLQTACQQQADKLNDDFNYIQENASSIFMSCLSSLLFSGSKKSDKAQVSNEQQSTAVQPNVALGAADYFTIVKSMAPVLWDIVQPIIVSWSIKKARKWILNLFSKKRNSPQ